MPLVKMRVKASNVDHATTVIKAKGFEMIIDEPVNLGGNNLGPNPLEYLLAALAGCLAVSGRGVAKEMGFELRDVNFEVIGELDPSKFMGQPTTERAGFQMITVKTKVDADCDAETLTKWAHEIEERCPVSDSIRNGTTVKIELA